MAAEVIEGNVDGIRFWRTVEARPPRGNADGYKHKGRTFQLPGRSFPDELVMGTPRQIQPGADD